MVDTSSILYRVGQKVAELTSGSSSGFTLPEGVIQVNASANYQDFVIGVDDVTNITPMDFNTYSPKYYIYGPPNTVPLGDFYQVHYNSNVTDPWYPYDEYNSPDLSSPDTLPYRLQLDVSPSNNGEDYSIQSQLDDNPNRAFTNQPLFLAPTFELAQQGYEAWAASQSSSSYPYTASVMGDYPAGSTNPDEFIFPAVGSYQSSQSYMLNTLIPFNNTSASSSVSASEYIDGASASVGTNQSGMSRFTVIHEGMYLVNFNISARLYGNPSDTWVQVDVFLNGTKFGYSGYGDEDLSTGSPSIPGSITNENHYSTIRLRGNTVDASKRFASMSLPVYFYANDYIEFKFSRNLVAGPGSQAELTSPTYFSITRMGI